MKKMFLYLLVLFSLVGCGSDSPAAVLVQSPNGTYVVKSSLSAANTAADAVGKTVVVTSPLSLTANLTLATDRAWKFERGAVVTTTGYTLNTNGATIIAGDYQIFAGTGTVTGMKDAQTSWFNGDLQRAVTAATYTVTIGAPVTLSAPVTISKALTINFNATVSASPGFAGNGLVYIDASGVLLKNPLLNAANVPPLGAVYNGSQAPKGYAIYAKGTAGTPLTGVKIQGGKIENAAFSGIFAEYCPDIEINGVAVNNAAYQIADAPPAAVYVIQSPRASITNNTIDSAGLKSISLATGSTGANVLGNRCTNGGSGHAAIFAANVADFVINGNVLEDQTGIKIDGGASGKSGWMIVNNVMRGVETGVVVQGGESGIIAGNTIDDPTGDGIYLGGDPTDNTALKHIVVNGNTIRRTGTPTNVMDGIQIYHAAGEGAEVSNVLITGNMVINSYYGIRMRTAAGAVFSDVKIKDNFVATTVQDGIYLVGQNIEATGNRVSSAGVNALVVAGLSGATATGTIRLESNIISSTGNYGIYIFSSAVARSLYVNRNLIDGSAAAMIYSSPNISLLKMEGNETYNSTNTSTISITSHATTPLRVEFNRNNVDKRTNWSAGGGGITGVSQFNTNGTAVTTLPAGVVGAFSGSGTPEAAIAAPIGSTFHRTDTTPALYVKQTGTDNAGWIAK